MNLVPLQEFSRLARAAYRTGGAPRGWSRVGEYEQGSFKASLFASQSQAHGVLAVRGTVGWRDCIEDLRLLTGRAPRAWQAGREVITRAHAALAGGELLLTGHSIGGAYAQALGAEAGLRTLTFNAPGMLDALERQFPVRPGWIRAGHDHIVNVCVLEDWIWRLSGPTLGRVHCFSAAGAPLSDLFEGPAGVLRALRWGRKQDGRLARFLARSARLHSMSNFSGPGSLLPTELSQPLPLVA